MYDRNPYMQHVQAQFGQTNGQNGYAPNAANPYLYYQNSSTSWAPNPELQPRQAPVPSLSGRMVNSIDEISIQEVPMDNSISVFPQTDWKTIYTKTWTKEGTIKTEKYVLVQEESAQPQQAPAHVLLPQDIYERLDRIDETLKTLKAPERNRKNATKEEE